jgi:hypothetical protein
VTAASPADDRFHPPAEDHPLWTETSWYGFSLPERRLAGAIYPLFRPNLGTCSVGVHVWDDSAHEPWRVLYSRCLWHLPMPEGDLDDCEMGGLELRCLEPLSRYRVRYADARIALDLVYEGLAPPHALSVDPARGHLDQACRVSGRLELDGEEIAVEGFDMRDRSWHVRDDMRTTRAGYSYAIDGDSALHAMSMGGDDDGAIVAGFELRGGSPCDLVGGERRVTERDPAGGFPRRVDLTAHRRDGRNVAARGTCLSRFAFQATPGMFAWISLVEWEVDGRRIFGADQDIWSPDLLGSRSGASVHSERA